MSIATIVLTDEQDGENVDVKIIFGESEDNDGINESSGAHLMAVSMLQTYMKHVGGE